MLEVTEQRPVNNEYANSWINKLSPLTLNFISYQCGLNWLRQPGILFLGFALFVFYAIKDHKRGKVCSISFDPSAASSPKIFLSQPNYESFFS